MATTGLIHAFLIVVEDLFVYWGGRLGIEWWIVVGISLIIFLTFWRQILGGTRWLFKKIGL